MNKNVIGNNAGTIWRMLDEKRSPMSFDSLVKETKLSATDVAAAIGWLAREDKLWIAETEAGAVTFTLNYNMYY